MIRDVPELKIAGIRVRIVNPLRKKTYWMVESAPPNRPANETAYVELTVPVAFTDNLGRSSHPEIVVLALNVETLNEKIDESVPLG